MRELSIARKNFFFMIYIVFIFGIPFAKVVEIESQLHVKLKGVLLRFGLNCNGIWYATHHIIKE
jgi:hypothetical protein